jgi:hypothetical protein
MRENLPAGYQTEHIHNPPGATRIAAVCRIPLLANRVADPHDEEDP